MVENEFKIYDEKRYSNKIELENCGYCGCDNCGTLFSPKLITEWIDEGNDTYTAKCPFCYCDDIIPLGDEQEQSINLFKSIMAYFRSVEISDVKVNLYTPPKDNDGILKVRILKGTNQIGGCITEIESGQARIIIDFGEDLEKNKDSNTVPQIEGLTYGTPKYDAVFITHSHLDHIGLINYILPEIPVYVEEKSQMIYELLSDFTNKAFRKDTQNVWFNNWYDEYAYIPVKDIKVKYYRVDHSSYNSSMILIECGNKRVLHTGDFRNHGYKSWKFIPTLKKIGKIDCLITEGTCFSRDDIKYQTEQELSDEATKLFKSYNQIFILQSSTNIDRITSFFKASVKTKKKFIEDIFTANITLNIGDNIPNPKFENNKVSVWVPQAYTKKAKEFKQKYIEPLKEYNNVENVYNDYAMMVKTSMYDDIKLLYDKGKITNACLVYSMWEGYLDKPEMKEFVERVKGLGIDFKIIHTSGHADLETIKLVSDILKPNKLIAIHTTNKEKAKEIFDNANIIEDNEIVNI